MTIDFIEPAAVAADRPAAAIGRRPTADPVPALRTEWLPVRVRSALTESELVAVAALRSRSYGRHLPQMASQLQQPDDLDRSPDATVLVAHAKDDGRLVGTLRLQHNARAPLLIEASTALPPVLQGLHLVEAARLCIEQGASPLVRYALFKALFLHCRHHQVDAVVAVARRPLDRLYRQLQFRSAWDGDRQLPMKHIGNLPHRLLVLHMATLSQGDAAAAHPMHGFVLQTHHPDILPPWCPPPGLPDRRPLPG